LSELKKSEYILYFVEPDKKLVVVVVVDITLFVE
jgi:hypothetical protein